MSNLSRFKDEEEHEGFTSMIDIVFLLLIFFILQPFKQPDLRLDSPMKDSGKNQTPEPFVRKPIVVRITSLADAPKEASFEVNKVAVGTSVNHAGDNLGALFVSKSAGDPKVPVVVMPSKGVRFQHVLQVLDECHEAGLGKVSFEAP